MILSKTYSLSAYYIGRVRLEKVEQSSLTHYIVGQLLDRYNGIVFNAPSEIRYELKTDLNESTKIRNFEAECRYMDTEIKDIIDDYAQFKAFQNMGKPSTKLDIPYVPQKGTGEI